MVTAKRKTKKIVTRINHKTKRKSYLSLEKKKDAIEYEDLHGKKSAARKYRVQPNQIRYFAKQLSKINEK